MTTLYKLSEIEPNIVFIGSVALYLHGLVDRYRDIDISIQDTTKLDNLFFLRSKKLQETFGKNYLLKENKYGIKRDSFYFDEYLVDVFIHKQQIDFVENEQKIKYASLKNIIDHNKWMKDLNPTNFRTVEKYEKYLKLTEGLDV